MQEIDESYVILSAQTALLGSVIPTLRAVIIKLNLEDDFLFIQFIYDCAIDDQIFDISSCTACEISANLPLRYDYDWEAVRIDYPQVYAIEGTLIFQRYEQQCQEFRKISILPIAEKYRKYPLAGACLAAQKALLGIVTPELRAVALSLDEEKKECYLKFYYDQNIPENILGLWTSAISEAGSYFFPEYRLSGEIKRLDYPNKISVDGSYVYLQREP